MGGKLAVAVVQVALEIARISVAVASSEVAVAMAFVIGPLSSVAFTGACCHSACTEVREGKPQHQTGKTNTISTDLGHETRLA
jgi:hypothetical protein